MKGKIPVVEIFGPVVQGEGALCGQISYFLRSGHCSFRCRWCDSLHAVTPSEVRARAEQLDPQQIIDRIAALAPPARKSAWVTLSGGDPVLWDMGPVVIGLHLLGFRVAVETQAHLWKDWLETCDLVTASPKGPSSGMVDKFKYPTLQKYAVRLGEKLVIKVVCFTQEDLDWAERIHLGLPQVKFFLSSGSPMEEENQGPDMILEGYRNLSEEVLKRPMLHDATVLPQIHALLYGRELGR